MEQPEATNQRFLDRYDLHTIDARLPDLNYSIHGFQSGQARYVREYWDLKEDRAEFDRTESSDTVCYETNRYASNGHKFSITALGKSNQIRAIFLHAEPETIPIAERWRDEFLTLHPEAPLDKQILPFTDDSLIEALFRDQSRMNPLLQ